MNDAFNIVFGVCLVFALYFSIFWFVVRILHRMGFSGWWSLMIFFWPIGLGMLAFSRWPAIDKDLN
jgi:uncharacterized membrane protein YhaH (DUF805 family)